jgi:O-antigen/teichoic acid export membrane protein
LVPLYTGIFAPEEYGVLSELMVVVAFAMVVLTYGFETAFFHFTNKENDSEKVLSTGFTSLLTSSLLFLFIASNHSQNIANLLHVPEHPNFINWLVWIMVLDVLTTLPFAKLRVCDRAWRFAFIRLTNITVNIGLNLFFYLLCPYLLKQEIALEIINGIYDPNVGIGYIFISNLIASSVMLILLSPEIFKLKFSFDFQIWKKMIKYGFPLLIGGLAYVTNEMVDRLLLEYLLPADTATAQVGIYSACYKIAIFMSLFIQAFRYGAEPFFFAQAQKKDAKEQYAIVMRYFIAFTAFIFLSINVFIDIVKHFIQDEAYHAGLDVVPILLLANLFLGMYYNLSVWYKVSEKTRFGAYLSLAGAAITIGLNILLIPTMSYMGSAWATLICYASMCVMSYIFSRRHYPISYNWKYISFYMISALSLFYIWTLWHDDHFIMSSLFCIIYIFSVVVLEKRKKISTFNL